MILFTHLADQAWVLINHLPEGVQSPVVEWAWHDGVRSHWAFAAGPVGSRGFIACFLPRTMVPRVVLHVFFCWWTQSALKNYTKRSSSLLPRFSRHKCKASSQHCYIFPTNITNKLQYIYSTALRFGCWVWTNFKVEMFVCCYLELPKNVNNVVSSLEKIWSFGNKNRQQQISAVCHQIKTLKVLGKKSLEEHGWIFILC